MPFDPSIPLQAKAPSFDESLKPISSMLGVQNAMQEMQSRNIQNQSNQAILQERNNVRQLFQNPQQFMDESGNIDFNKATPAIMEAAPTQGGQIITQLVGAQRSAIDTRRSLNSLTDEQRASVGQYVMAQADSPPDVVRKNLDGLAQLQPGLKPAVEHAWKYLLAPSANDPKAFKTAVLKAGQSVMSPAQQVTAMTPNVVQNDNGQQIVSTNINPLAEGGIGAHPIAPIQKQLPPTTPTFNAGTSAGTNAPGYLGSISSAEQNARDQERIRILQDELANERKPQNVAALQREIDRTQQGIHARGGAIASGPALGAEAGTAGTQNTINEHWKNTVSGASTAAQDIGLLQNIKKYAAGASTGVGADRDALIKGIAGKLGVSEAELAKTDTDLLAKNSNMLALAGGNTDAARVLAAAANPNNHMTKEAIHHAADQIIAQKNMAIAQQKFLLPFKGMADAGHPEVYNNALTQFNSAADPRIFQLSNMSQDEKIKMKAAMTPKERQEFGEKIRKLQSLGVIQ